MITWVKIQVSHCPKILDDKLIGDSNWLLMWDRNHSALNVQIMYRLFKRFKLRPAILKVCFGGFGLFPYRQCIITQVFTDKNTYYTNKLRRWETHYTDLKLFSSRIVHFTNQCNCYSQTPLWSYHLHASPVESQIEKWAERDYIEFRGAETIDMKWQKVTFVYWYQKSVNMQLTTEKGKMFTKLS